MTDADHYKKLWEESKAKLKELEDPRQMNAVTFTSQSLSNFKGTRPLLPKDPGQTQQTAFIRFTFASGLIFRVFSRRYTTTCSLFYSH